jgi:ribosomal-protein-alanine N-acetyltransferase
VTVPVREATSADVEAIVALEQECLAADAWSAALVADAVTSGASTCLVAGAPGTVVGHAVASYAGDLADLQRIAVDPPHRRRGIAAALLGEVVTRAARAGADRVLLEVRADNEGALAFYARQGFTEVDRRARYYRDGATAVVLVRPLDRGAGGQNGRDD